MESNYMTTERFILEGGIESGLRGSLPIDLSGMTINDIYVIGRAGNTKRSGNAKWLCRCHCGKEFTVVSHVLRTRQKSCGCRTRRKFLDGNFGQVVSQTKKDALSRGYAFELTEEDMYTLHQQDCHYCGRPPSNCKKSSKYTKKGNLGYKYNGIDRKDNNTGYTLDNCVTCCKYCNIAKHHQTYEFFIDMVRNIALRHTDLVEK